MSFITRFFKLYKTGNFTVLQASHFFDRPDIVEQIADCDTWAPNWPLVTSVTTASYQAYSLDLDRILCHRRTFHILLLVLQTTFYYI